MILNRKSFLLPLAIIILLPACARLDYLYHAAGGHFRLMRNSVPVKEALQSDKLGPEEKKKLKMISRVKAFGEERLGLEKTDNYEKVYLESSRDPIYLVSAAPKDCLCLRTWWFPVVGNMPYLGFFERQRALEKKQKLLDEDLDVFVSRATAYSTLGWFEDPVTLNILQLDTLDLTEIILHEMTHNTIYVQDNPEFNEGLAQFAGKLGAKMFCEERVYGTGHPLSLEARRSI